MPCITPTRALAPVLVALFALACAPALADPPPPLTLTQAFDQAWARQPEARALAQRRDAAAARREAAAAWTPEPVALEASLRSDRLHQAQGARELALGLALPLWLPGERQGAQADAAAAARLTEARAEAQRWQLAGALRQPWWQALREREELAAAQGRLASLQALAADVARRTKAGDLARADQHQADTAVAAARADAASAQARVLASEARLRALLGLAADAPLALDAQPEPEPPASFDPAAHPLLAALQAQADQARAVAGLARLRSRANPELTLLHTRDRAARGEPSNGTVALGIRWPLGRSSAQAATQASAGADLTEAEVAAERERERLHAEVAAARAGRKAATTVLAAATERARLAGETREFFAKSFRLGETDLPTRLRVEQDAATAERELARARIELHQATATLRQALGLLPGQL